MKCQSSFLHWIIIYTEFITNSHNYSLVLLWNSTNHNYPVHSGKCLLTNLSKYLAAINICSIYSPNNNEMKVILSKQLLDKSTNNIGMMYVNTKYVL